MQFIKVFNCKLKNLLFVLLIMSALPWVVRSESNSDATQQINNVSTTTTTIDNEVKPETVVNNYVSDTPYTTEPLIGNKVFKDFVLGPGKVELDIKPGESKTINMTVSNRFANNRKFRLDIEDIGNSSDPTRPIVLLGDDKGPYTLRDFISIPHMEFSLDNNRRATIPVTITIPKDAEPGGHYGSVLVKTVTSPAREGDINKGTAPASAIVSRIGTIFFITIPGKVETSGELKQFFISNNQKYFSRGPIDFNILYENTGAIHLNPYGEMRIINMFGEEVGFVELDPWFTLPKSVRLRAVSWNRDLLYGRYTAKLSLNRGYDDIIDEASVTFWVIPWKPLLGVFAVIFVIFFLMRSFFRKFEFKRKDS